MKIHKFILLIMVLVVALSPHDAQAKNRRHTHHTPHKRHHFAGVSSDAEYSDIVIDAETGRIIHETDSDSLRHPASLTKMMTLYLAFQALESGRITLGQYLPVSSNAAYQSPSKLGLRPGQRIRVEDAILGIITESANDAAMAMGEALGGSSDGFAALMTKQARALGMKRTVFQNPNGLPDPDQVTTARDMAILGAALVRHYPRYYPYFSHDSFTYAGIYHHNHNHLMERYDGMDGIKTGYIRASGFNLVASAKHGDTRLIGVVFGGRSAVARDNHMAELLDDSFAAAQVDARNGRVAQMNGEGDSSDSDSDGYIALPGKIAAVFPSRNAIPQPAASQPTMQTQSQQAQPVVQRPAAAPVQAASGWGIQIGAYSDPAVGQQALASLVASMPQMLSGGVSQVQEVSAGGVTMYRARLMSLDQRTAQSICSYLVQRGKSCLTVGP